jgi:hypothetical protein
MNTLGEMNGWLSLPLILLFGQTPSSPATPDELERTTQELEVKQLRAEVELLQARLEAQQQEHQNRLQSLEQQEAAENARAQALEDLRQQRLALLRSGYRWMVTVDQLLEEGDFSIGPALTYARQDLSEALASAAETGRGQTVRLIGSALDRLATLEEAVEQRNLYQARLQLQDAGFELQEAWRLSLQRQGATLVNQ